MSEPLCQRGGALADFKLSKKLLIFDLFYFAEILYLIFKVFWLYLLPVRRRTFSKKVKELCPYLK